jgi:hypothetical protein
LRELDAQMRSVGGSSRGAANACSNAQRISPPAVSAVLAAQRSAGNAAVARLLAAPANHLLRARPPAEPDTARDEHIAAQAALKRDRDKLRSALEEGRSRADDLMLRNTVEWIERGTMGAKLYAVRQTADSNARALKPEGSTASAGEPPAQEAKKSPAQAAFFPRADETDESGDIHDNTLPGYAWQDLDDNRGVRFDRPETGGWNAGGRLIAIRVENAPKEELWRRLKHEVQHSADRHHDVVGDLITELEPLERLASVSKIFDDRAEALCQSANQASLEDDTEPSEEEKRAREAEDQLSRRFKNAGDQVAEVVGKRPKRLLAQKAFETFKTEYRAYWYMSDPAFEKLSTGLGLFGKGGEVSHGLHWTPRQHAIVNLIRKGYPLVGQHFDKNSRLPDGRTFREAVWAYRLPDQHGMNKLNSVRVNTFYEALKLVPAATNDASHPAVAAVLRAAEALQPSEAEYLAEPAQASEMTRLMRERLARSALDAVTDALKSRSPSILRALRSLIFT